MTFFKHQCLISLVSKMIRNIRIEEFYIKETSENPTGTINDHVHNVLQKLENEMLESNMEIDMPPDPKTRKKLIKKVVETRKRELKNGKENRGTLDLWREECFAKIVPKRHKGEESSLPVGRPKKIWSDGLSKKTKEHYVDDIVSMIEEKAGEKTNDRLELLDLVNEHCKKKWKVTENEKSEIPVSTACGLIYNINWSLRQYQELRLALLNHNVRLPTRNTIDSYKKTLIPLSLTVESTKTSCDLSELILQTTQSILEDVNVNINGAVLSLESKFGLDGSGSHSIRHQLVEDVEDCNNYIGAFWSPLHLKIDNDIVWENPLPNSILYCRPVCLMREKENRESVLEHFKPIFDDALSIEENGLLVRHVDGIDPLTIPMKINIEMSMIDGKMADIIQGDTGSFCHYCHVSRNDANDLTCILQGFQITKTYAQVAEAWRKLNEGEIHYNDSSRQGQCHEPMIQKDLRYFANLHQKLRSLDMALKFLYHLVSGQTHTWSESNANVKLAIKAAKDEVGEHIRLTCGGLVVDKASANGGNTNTGPVADRFFSAENRVNICSLIKKTCDRENFCIMLGYFNKMLAVTQRCDKNMVANSIKVKQLGMDMMTHFKRFFPWAMLSPSVHQMAAHSWQLFEMTDGQPIAIYSEQCSESWNKYIRSYKSGSASRARQCSIKVNTKDVFTRMLIQSHPKIASQKRYITCSKCGKKNHSVASCPARFVTVSERELSEILDIYT